MNAFINSPEIINTAEIQNIPVNNRNRNKLVIIVLIAIGVVGVFLFLLYKYYAPFGKVVSYTFTSKLPGAQDATTFPASKDNLLTIPSQIIKTPQAKFSVNLLSPNVNSIHAKLRFKKNTKEIKVGVRGNETDGFTYHPLYYSLLQDLNWNQLNENDLTLWQKEKKYTSLFDFVNTVSLEKKIATYFVDTDKLSLIKPSNVAEGVHTAIISQFRGTHRFFVRVDKAPLIVKVAKQDMNAYEGEDKVKIVVSKDEKIVAEQTIPDDDISTASNLKMQSQETTVTVGDIKPGLYQLDLISEAPGSDSLVTKLDVNQQKVVLKDYFYSVEEKPSLFWTDAKNLTLTTWHPRGLQTVKLNGDVDLKITELNKKYTFDLKELSDKKDTSLYQLEFPKNDLVVIYDGYIVFNKENYFEPQVIKSLPLTDFESLDGVDYILTSYQKAKQDGDWMVAETTFDPKDIKITGDTLYFSLEMSDLDKYGGELEIDSLEIDVKSDGVLSKVGKEKKEVVKPAAKGGEKKQNIFSRFFGWVGEKATTAINTVKRFFGGIVGKFSGKKTAKPTPTPTKPPAGISPTLKPSLTPTPTATSASAIKFDLLVRVLNGGAEKGTASSVAAELKNNGFTNVRAENAERFDYLGVTIQSRKDDTRIVEKIESLLKKEYGTITKTLSATAEAVIILGKK